MPTRQPRPSHRAPTSPRRAPCASGGPARVPRRQLPRRRRHPTADGRSMTSSTNSPRRPMSSSSTRRPWFPSRRRSPPNPPPDPRSKTLAQVLAAARVATATHRGTHLFDRSLPLRRRTRPTSRAGHAGDHATRPIAAIVVTASRYSLASDVPEVHTFLSQEELEALPRLAEDALKVVHRLPGAASNGLAGLAHMRGGDTNETLVHARRPAALRAVSPAPAAKPGERAR